MRRVRGWSRNHGVLDVLDRLAESSIILPGCKPEGDAFRESDGLDDEDLSSLGRRRSLLAGCKVDSDDVEQWKGTVKGPIRLVAVIGSDRYEPELRTEAALALVEMDRNDVNALALLKKSLDDLRAEDPASSQTIVCGMIPRLEALLAAGADPDDGAPDPVQVRAKDAAYMVIPYAPEQQRDELIRSVVRWYSTDFEGRSLAGDYSAEQVTRALGAEAAGMLVDALHEKMTPACDDQNRRNYRG